MSIRSKFSLAVVIALLTTFVAAGEARADGGQYQLINTTGLGAYPRATPNYGSATGTALPEGSYISGSCWLYGETITNPYGYSSDIWIQDADGLYWPEVWLDTGSYGPPAGMSDCANASSGTPSAAETNAFYNRDAAVAWALANGPYDTATLWGPATCTWFVSQALWAGGFPQDSTWTSEGEHGRYRKAPGSLTAWAVPELMTYLEQNYSITAVGLDSARFAANVVPEAETGDLIVYDWENDGTFDHFTIVTNIADGQYPEVSEWGVNATYAKRGWTWSEKYHKYFQEYHPNLVAKLLHFNGGVHLPTF